jgi:hypothetical protein
MRDIGGACCAAKWKWCSAAKRILHVFGNNFSRIIWRMDEFGRVSRPGVNSVM